MYKCTLTIAAIANTLLLSCGATTAQPPVDNVKINCVLPPPDPQAGGEPSTDLPLENTIQVALLLDVSSSMDGLINQAKSELWNVVNEVAQARKNGKEARLEIALYDYGKDTHPIKNGYVRQLLNFTSDLDTVSEVLFSLNTNGGSEYCGTVINAAIKELEWKHIQNYDVIFIAGNEPFNQGKQSYIDACRNAWQKDVIVNTIHCGDEQEGIRGLWKDGATKGGGEYFWINSNTVERYIASPYDEAIESKNDSLNFTYWGYGSKGKAYKSNQMVQDNNASSFNKKIALDRGKSKIATKQYEATAQKWDITSKAKADEKYLEVAKDEELPQELQNKTVEQRKKIVKENGARRDNISAELTELYKKRDAYVAQKRKEELATKNESSLGSAIGAAIRKQGAAKGFVWPKD